MDDLFKEHAWGSIDSDSSDDDCDNVPNLTYDSSATSGDEGALEGSWCTVRQCARPGEE